MVAGNRDRRSHDSENLSPLCGWAGTARFEKAWSRYNGMLGSRTTTSGENSVEKIAAEDLGKRLSEIDEGRP